MEGLGQHPTRGHLRQDHRPAEGDSEVRWFEGNWHEYEEDRKKRLGAEADQPHRVKYRKLVRG